MARPREFAEEKVLKTAVDAFWARGYSAISTRDLTEHTGLAQNSICAAFGDKRGIFLRSLEYYVTHVLRERIIRLETSQSPSKAISGFSDESLERSITESKHRGCVLVDAALEVTPDDSDIRRLWQAKQR